MCDRALQGKGTESPDDYWEVQHVQVRGVQGVRDRIVRARVRGLGENDGDCPRDAGVMSRRGDCFVRPSAARP